jgi:CRP-like cAMP-binding protein
VLFREGEPGDRMYVIADGQVRIVKRVAGAEITIATLRTGDCFGEMSLLDDQPRSATAVVAQDSVLVVIERGSFEQLVRDNGEIAVRIMRRLSSRLREANRRLTNYLAENGSRRAVEVIRQSSSGDDRGVRRLPRDASATWLAPRAGLSIAEAEEVWDRLHEAAVLRTDRGGVEVADDGVLDEYLAYLDLKQEFDPITTRELAELTGLPASDIERVARRVLMSHLGDANAATPMVGDYQRYLALKRRFEFPDPDAQAER